MLIGIVGGMGSGKSTLTNFLVEEFGFIQKSLAGKLKTIAKELNLYDYDFLRKLGLRSPRDALQRLAHVFRDGISEEFWLMQVEGEIENSLIDGLDIVISDIRYLNELRWIKLLGGYILGIKINPKIACMRSRVRGALRDRDMSISEFYQYSKHSSESQINDLLSLADLIINGDLKLEHFLREGRKKIELMIKEDEECPK